MVHTFYPVSLINPFSINYRNHRKIVVIDHCIGYFGGINIGDEYANADQKQKYRHWRDTHIRVTGPTVQFLEKQFLVDWYTSSTKNQKLLEEIGSDTTKQQLECYNTDNNASYLPLRTKTENVPVQLISAGPDEPKDDVIRDALVHTISRAKKSVYIESPYFTPDTVFFSTLKIAALSGVDVQVVIPGDWDKWYVKKAAMPYIRDLQAYGVKFWFYPGFIHAKMFIVDETIVTIGSTNVDNRSFSLHFELNAFFYSKEFCRKCVDMFFDDRNISEPVTADYFKYVSIFRYASWNFCKLFAPLM
ncbi:phospholipase D-like domain-containing protein [Brucepastera parasyntrophica]|uniref:phospholipase D-like domain-containing protein n=1 Tax=Brucepastera parasyntrophica TaxID=2880008 RepID=UPI00210E674A|nr:phospholipase D-like domain-containing protein [Brucepastera parasyntrophica]ULQ59142.1 phospholipase D-like domain-containing protein [Brucepastera parasyntrophica]